jgi:hypothetical protein
VGVEGGYPFDAEESVKLIAVIGGLVLGAMFIAFVTFAVWIEARRKVRQAEAFENSRREIAAYVAEGSIAPDDASKMLATGRSLRSRIIDEL